MYYLPTKRNYRWELDQQSSILLRNLLSYFIHLDCISAVFPVLSHQRKMLRGKSLTWSTLIARRLREPTYVRDKARLKGAFPVKYPFPILFQVRGKWDIKEPLQSSTSFVELCEKILNSRISFHLPWIFRCIVRGKGKHKLVLVAHTLSQLDHRVGTKNIRWVGLSTRETSWRQTTAFWFMASKLLSSWLLQAWKWKQLRQFKASKAWRKAHQTSLPFLFRLVSNQGWKEKS